MPRERAGRGPALVWLILLMAMPLAAGGGAAAGIFEPALKWLRGALAKGGRYKTGKNWNSAWPIVR